MAQLELFHSAGTCSFSPLIVLNESDSNFKINMVNFRAHTLADGSDYYAINPKGQVPCLKLENGELLTEGVAIVQYIADKKGDKNLLPPVGDIARYRVLELLNMLTSEVHTSYHTLFRPLPEESKKDAREKLTKHYTNIEKQLSGKDYLTGSTFTVADAYLYTLTRWAAFTQFDLSPFPNVQAFQKRVEARPKVQKALSEEGTFQG